MLAGTHVYDDGKANLLGACRLTETSCLCWVASYATWLLQLMI